MKTKTLIKKLGGGCAVARICDITSTAVYEWIKKDKIPRDRLITLALVAEEQGITSRQLLFPSSWRSIWPELAQNQNQPKKETTP